MKKKILLIFKKLKSIKKRVWAIIVFFVLCLIALAVFWGSLDKNQQLYFRGKLGDSRALEDLGSYYMHDVCWGNNYNRASAYRAIDFYLESGTSDAINFLLSIAYSGNRSECYYNNLYKLVNDIDEKLIRKFDSTELEKYLLNSEQVPVDYLRNLYFFYMRNRAYSEAEAIFSKIMDTCLGNNLEKERNNCLFHTAKFMYDIRNELSYDFVGDFKVNITMSVAHMTKGIEVFNKLMESAVGELKQRAKYLFAQFMVYAGEGNKALPIIYELANQKYYPALILLGQKAQREGKIILAEEYFSIVSDSHEDKSAFVYLYELYNNQDKYKEKPLKYRDKVFSDWDRIYYLAAGIGKDIDIVDWYPSFRTIYNKSSVLSNYALILAILYSKKKEYTKAQDIYEKIIRYYENPRINSNNQIYYEALTQLGHIYYQGLGQRQDLKKALDYYGRACDFKYQEACDKFREVQEKIPLPHLDNNIH